MAIQAVAIVGTKKSGKTTTTESLIRELTKKGYKVAAIKHVSEPEFTIDTPGKDTWRFAQSGAKTIVSAAANEVATIQKKPLNEVTIKELVRKCSDNDIVLIEGLKKRLARTQNIQKIVVVKSKDEANYALEAYKPILAFSGPYNAENINSGVPYVDAMKNPEKLAKIIEEKLLKK